MYFHVYWRYCVINVFPSLSFFLSILIKYRVLILDVNECLLPQPPCPSHLCENTIGGYKCGGITGDPANLPSRQNRPQPEDRCPVGFRAGLDEECEGKVNVHIHVSRKRSTVGYRPLSNFAKQTDPAASASIMASLNQTLALDDL